MCRTLRGKENSERALADGQALQEIAVGQLGTEG